MSNQPQVGSRGRSKKGRALGIIEYVRSLDDDETSSFALSYFIGVEMLLQDLPCPDSVHQHFTRLLYNVVGSGDLLGFIDACSLLRAGLISSGNWDTNLSKGSRHRWVRGLAKAIDHAMPSSLCAHPSPLFSRLATFLGWLKRIPVCIRPLDQGIDAYMETEGRISSINFDECGYVPLLRQIWFEWFGEFRLTEPFLPRHGTGSTADCGRIRHDKWRSLRVDRRSRVMLRNARLELDWTLPEATLPRVAKVVFVPKQAGKDRTICMEPAVLQYLQQGVARQWVEFAHSSSCGASTMVDIFSQENNRSLCAQAWGAHYATIDLSDASDSVSWRLIKALCRGLPLLRYLYACRSDRVTLGGNTISIDKYAPMGSALCFPTECYVFASIVELAYRMHYGRASRGVADGCSVYGDDIICPSEIYHLVVDILCSLGFVVNPEKSYSSGPYYESCGVEYLQGMRVHTVRHPRKLLACRSGASPEAVGMVTDLSNSLLLYGCLDARRLLLLYYKGETVTCGNRKRPFMDLVKFDDEHLVPVIDYPPRNVRWDANLQRSYTEGHEVHVTTSRAGSDFTQWKSDNVRRCREQRIIDLHPPIRQVDADPKFSAKAVLWLSSFGFLEELERGTWQVAGAERTGRQVYAIRSVRIGRV